MSIVPIRLGIARNSGSASAAKADGHKLPAEIKQKILERDDHVCQCCGFKSMKYQDILHKNGDESSQKEDNLATVCMFCHQCFNLESVSIMRSGVLIWLPEIKQSELHHIARAIYVARISQGPMSDAARRSLDALMHRREEARKRIHTDDPFLLATVLKDYITPNAYKLRVQKLEGIRLFPLDRRIIKEADLEFNQFPQILAYWRSKDGPFGGRVPKQWVNIYREIMTKAA